MPESPYVQQSIAAKKQAQQAQNSYKQAAKMTFIIQMQEIIHARQLEVMRGSLGV